MCAGAKTASDGSGYNNAPMGVGCTFNTFYERIENCDNRQSGYATIINYDANATHYGFYGYADKC